MRAWPEHDTTRHDESMQVYTCRVIQILKNYFITCSEKKNVENQLRNFKTISQDQSLYALL